MSESGDELRTIPDEELKHIKGGQTPGHAGNLTAASNMSAQAHEQINRLFAMMQNRFGGSPGPKSWPGMNTGGGGGGGVASGG